MDGAISERAERAMGRVADAARRVGRSPSDVTVVAATKGVGPDEIARALDAGIRVVGENRAQELLAKIAEPHIVDLRCEWHFIGRLQRNKVRQLVDHVGLWHTIDREELGIEIARRMPGARVLVQVNVDGDPNKGGCAPARAGALVDELRSQGLDVRGLMVIPAASGDPRPAFDATAALGGSLELPELSMGMSRDFEEAIAAGATIVRLGSAIFGNRGPGVPRQ